jgi:hypothetical protein
MKVKNDMMNEWRNLMAFDAKVEPKKVRTEEARIISKWPGTAIHWAPDGNYRENSFALIYDFGPRELKVVVSTEVSK